MKKPCFEKLTLDFVGISHENFAKNEFFNSLLTGWGKPDSLERRWQRFLSNPHLDWSHGCTALAPTRLIVLLVDETSLRDKLNERWPMGQVELIRTLLDWVAPAIPSGRTVLAEMNRSLVNSPRLVRAQVRWWREVSRGRRAQHSVFVLGLRLLTRRMKRLRRIPLKLKFIIPGETR